MKLSLVIDQLVEERALDRSVLSNIICEGMLAAYQKRYPELIFKVEHDKKTDDIVVSVQKEVVSNVENEDTQISVRKARFIDKDADIGSHVWLPFEGKIGRIEILRAKQVIAGKIRKIEAEAIYNEFKHKEGTIVHGIVHKCERGGVVVKLQDSLAFLPRSLTIPTDKCVVGHPIRALLKEVLLEPRNENQLILDRVSDAFLKGLFELEIPEVFEKLVEIKKIVRIPGYKSKVAVISHDPNIDPVGTCVGVGGVRIKPILKELNSEKIDVIAWSDSLETLVKSALKPAEINRVEVESDTDVKVWLDDDQRSLAIGKMGQNISLASRLTGVNIHLVQSSESGKQHEGVVEAFNNEENQSNEFDINE
ncbi:MAG TPA: transcription termination factor NusA [Candidatus Babeliales bacterium]|nr:transcription termination factor NusA [Candidatus Babeliales bacterium]